MKGRGSPILGPVLEQEAPVFIQLCAVGHCAGLLRFEALWLAEETYTSSGLVSKETYTSVQRDLH